MRTVGQILLEARKKRRLDIAAVATATKIRPQFLRAIEANNFTKLPSATTASGFIKNYAAFLGLAPKFVLAVFRRDFAEDEKGRIIPRGLVKPLDQPKLLSSPRTGLFLLTGFFVLLVVGYLVWQYFSLIKGPSLNLSSPLPDVLVDSSLVEVIGKTEPDASVKVNNELIKIAADGSFATMVSLEPGENKLMVEATNKLGKTTRIEQAIIRKSENADDD